MESTQYAYRYLGKWYFANTINYGSNIHLNDAHGIKLDSVVCIPSSDLIGLRVKYGGSEGVIKEVLPTKTNSYLKTHYPYSKNKLTKTPISDVGVYWRKRGKNENLYYWMDINKLEWYWFE